MNPDRLAEIDIAIDIFRQTHPGSFGEMVAELRAEVDRLNAELDYRESSSDRAATREIDLRVERDEAREIARHAATALTTSCRELDGEDDLDVLLSAWSDWHEYGQLPDWLTPTDQEGATRD